MDDGRRTARHWAGVLGLLGAYTVALFFPLVGHLVHRPTGPARWLEGDVAEEYWPDLVALCHGLHAGHLPRWNPWEHAGTPFAADPQVGAYHPVNLALCLVGGASPSIHLADFRVALHFYLAAVFMALFLRGEGIAWRGALTGAVLFPLTPFLRHNWELNLTYGFAYLPLVLAALRAVCVRPSAARAMALALACALSVLVGSPPAVYYLALVAAPFAVGCVLQGDPTPQPSPQIVGRVPRVPGEVRAAGAGPSAVETPPAPAPRFRASQGFRGTRGTLPTICGEGCGVGPLVRAFAITVVTLGGLAAPALVPARALAALSVRSQPTYAAMAAEGLPVRGLLGVLLPALNDHAYVGLLTLALAALAFVGPRPFRARWPFAFIALVGAVWMLGDHGPMFRVGWALVPGARLFRNPTRYAALWGTAMAVLAAAGADALPTVSRRALAWSFGVPFVLAAVVTVHPGIDPFTHGAGLVRAFAALVLGGGCALVLARRRPEVTAAIVLLALCADLWPWLPAARHTRAGPLPEGTGVYRAWRSLAGGDVLAYRVWDEFGVRFRAGERYGFREMRGYRDPMELSRYQKVADALGDTPGLLAQFNVRWVLRGPHYLHGSGHHLLPDPAGAPWAVLRGDGIYELPAALPAAYWTDGALVARDADAALDRVRATAPSPVVVLEAGDVRAETVSAGTGRWSPAVEHLRLDGDGVTVTVDAPARGWLLVNEVWFPGWTATVDGVAVTVHRANGLVRAVRVPAGRHTVVMAYRPWMPRVLEAMAGITLVAMLGVFVQGNRAARGSTVGSGTRPWPWQRKG